MNNLKPCPFCGNEKIEIRQNCKNGLKIRCDNCGIRLEQKVLRYSIDWLRVKMINIWNNRTTLPSEVK